VSGIQWLDVCAFAADPRLRLASHDEMWVDCTSYLLLVCCSEPCGGLRADPQVRRFDAQYVLCGPAAARIQHDADESVQHGHKACDSVSASLARPTTACCKLSKKMLVDSQRCELQRCRLEQGQDRHLPQESRLFRPKALLPGAQHCSLLCPQTHHTKNNIDEIKYRTR
jgi:hypothetical protein